MKSLQYYSISLGNLLRGATDTKRPRETVITNPVIEVKIPTAIDTSHYDPPTDWSLIPKTVVFMGTKATEGTYYQDPTFPEIFSKTKTVLGIHRLAYHFFRKAYDPIKQADWFINYIGPYLDDTDILCLDFEEGGETASQLWAFLNRVIQRRPQNQLIIYSRKDLMNAIIMTPSEKAFFKTIPSWVAGYPYNPNIYTTTPEGYKPDPTKWGEVWMWQYSDAGQVAGFDGAALDVNLIEKPLLDYIGGTGETPPPTGDKMEQYEVTAFINIRPSAGNTTVDLGDLGDGDFIYVDKKQNVNTGQYTGDWLHFTKISRVGSGEVEDIAGWCWGKNTKLVTVTPPPASGDIDVHVVVSNDVVTVTVNGQEWKKV